MELKAQKQRISKVIEAYDNQGIHRTGTEGDMNNAQWLADEIKSLGLRPIMDGFNINRLDIKEASLKIEERNIKGIPMFDSIINDNEEITGSLGRFNSNAILGNSLISRDLNLEKERERNRHQGLVIAKKGAFPGFFLINAFNFKKPFGPPVLQISNESWSWIEQMIKKNAEATLTIRSIRTKIKAYNVIAHLEGKQSELPPLIITTPRSGWWHCASERGGGIAGFLEIMRTLCTSSPKRDIIFLANTGHELGNFGMQHYITNHPTLVKDTIVWIHLGANFAAANLTQMGVKAPPLVISQASDVEIEELALKCMSNEGVKPDRTMPIGEIPPRSEAQHIHEAGGRYFSIIGTNNYFHHPEDRWPKAVDINKTVKIIRSLVQLSIKLTN
ncbi:MAG: M28 family peptidase [Promethearchaeota archaeon]